MNCNVALRLPSIPALKACNTFKGGGFDPSCPRSRAGRCSHAVQAQDERRFASVGRLRWASQCNASLGDTSIGAQAGPPD